VPDAAEAGPRAQIRKTAAGQTLMLVDLAHMVQRVGELSVARDGPLIRLARLDPELAGSEPQPWEREALERFAHGNAREYTAFSALDSDTPRFRYAAPMRGAACPTCSEDPLRGAITVSLPAKPLVEAIASQRRTALVLGALLIGFGTVAILLLGRIARIQREALAKLRDLSLCDPLTGIHNRRGFTERSQQALRTLAREKGRAVLAFADLDGLKPINDTHGHKRGDEALKRLAKVLRPAFRGSDVVARIGGDEFAILFVDADWQYRAVLQKRIDKCVARANDGWTGSLPIEVSVGMVEINFSDRRQQEPPSVDELLSLADTRMYAVKVERRNTGTF
jgi:diguanylate cyclase (GGDEF)-like protein